MSSEQIDDKNRKVINFIMLKQVEQYFDRSVIEQAAIPIRYAINNRHRKTGWKTSAGQNVIWRQIHGLDLRRHIMNRVRIGYIVRKRNLIAGLYVGRCDRYSHLGSIIQTLKIANLGQCFAHGRYITQARPFCVVV